MCMNTVVTVIKFTFQKDCTANWIQTMSIKASGKFLKQWELDYSHPKIVYLQWTPESKKSRFLPKAGSHPQKIKHWLQSRALWDEILLYISICFHITGKFKKSKLLQISNNILKLTSILDHHSSKGENIKYIAQDWLNSVIWKQRK